MMSYNLLAFYEESGTNPAWVHIDTAAGEARTLLNMTGHWGKSAVPFGGKLYFGSGNTVKEFDPTTGGLRTVGTSSDSTIYTGCRAPDGILYFGTHDDGMLIEYNPTTDTFADLGRMDLEGPGYQYSYSLAADEDFVYVGLGQSPWYLGVYNRATGEKTLYFKNGGGSSGVSVGVDGTVWYGNYKMVDGTPESGHVKPEMIPSYWQSGANSDHLTWPEEIGYEIDLTDANPLPDAPAKIRWRAANGTWLEHAAPTLPLASQVLKRVYSFDATRLLIITAAYGPMALYTPSTGEIEILGWTDKSLYDAVEHDGLWHLSGYAGVTITWDPSQPWTVTPDNQITNGEITNPIYGCGIAKYHHYSAVGSDGLIYIGVTHERDSVGASLGWYNPATPGASVQRIREGLERWYPRGVAAVDSLIVMSTQSMDGLDGELVVLDTTTKIVIDRQTPLADLAYTSTGTIVRVSDTDLVGVIGTAAYRWNVASNTQVWRVTLPAAAMAGVSTIDRRIEVAPDGKIYFFIGTKIYALDPTDGAVVTVCNENVQGNVFWHQGQMYVYGTTKLRRLDISG